MLKPTPPDDTKGKGYSEPVRDALGNDLNRLLNFAGMPSDLKLISEVLIAWKPIRPQKPVLAGYIHPQGDSIPPFGGLRAHNDLGTTVTLTKNGVHPRQAIGRRSKNCLRGVLLQALEFGLA